MKQSYFKNHLIDILKTEDLELETIVECIELILENEILNQSTEDLEYQLTKYKKDT